MQILDRQAVYSATDLVGFLACEHLTHLDRAVLDGLVAKPFLNDAELDLIAERGRQHEARFLAELRGAHQNVVEIDDELDGLDRSAERSGGLRGHAAS